MYLPVSERGLQSRVHCKKQRENLPSGFIFSHLVISMCEAGLDPSHLSLWTIRQGGLGVESSGVGWCRDGVRNGLELLVSVDWC